MSHNQREETTYLPWPQAAATAEERASISATGTKKAWNEDPEVNRRIAQLELKPEDLQRFSHEQLGSGSFGIVIRGLLQTTNVPVAVKQPLMRCAEYEEPLMDEMLTMAKLQESQQHPNVLALIGVIANTADSLCIVTEFCENGSLEQFLRKKKIENLFINEIYDDTSNDIIYTDSDVMPIQDRIKTNFSVWHCTFICPPIRPRQIERQCIGNWENDFEKRRMEGKITTSDLLHFLLQLAQAMDYFIKHSIVHRDIALRNVLLKADFTVKVSDFGLAKSAGEKGYYRHRTASLIGLPPWSLAPELFPPNKPRFTEYTERWALGIAFWEMFNFCQQEPYAEECPPDQEMVDFISGFLRSHQRLTCPSAAPQNIKALLNQLWCSLPMERPSFENCVKIIEEELKTACPKLIVGISSSAALREPSGNAQVGEKLGLDKLSSELKQIYLNRLRRFNPFSFPFTFDIEKTWISLGLRQDISGMEWKEDEFIRMDDHCQLIREAFMANVRLLIIEGRAASGKTSLMRRIAYDWAKGLLNEYNLVLLVEFRDLQNLKYSTITELVLSGSQIWAGTELQDQLVEVFSSSNTNNKVNRFLILLDGYDEAKSTDVCAELTKYLTSTSPLLSLSLRNNIIISTRPGPLTPYNKEVGRLKLAQVLGFDTKEQQSAYIDAHFPIDKYSGNKNAKVKELLERNDSLQELAKSPLLLTFICHIHEHLRNGSIFELYRTIVWWLIDRYQKDHPELNVPSLFGFDKTVFDEEDESSSRIIQEHYLKFPLLREIGRLALDNCAESNFTNVDVRKYDAKMHSVNCGILLREEYRDGLRNLTRYLFPHRTLQEFLAGGCFYFWSDNSDCKASINAFLLKDKSFKEIENFIFRSVSSKNLSSGVRLYIERQAELNILTTSFHCATNDGFSDALNEVLRSCKNAKNLRLQGYRHLPCAKSSITEPLEINIPNLEKLEITFTEFTFDVRNPRSMLNFGNRSDSLKEIELNQMWLPSPDSFICTMNTLNKNLHRTALKFFNVWLEMTRLEGLREITFWSDSLPVSSFITKENLSRSFFPTELSYVLNYLASITELIIDYHAENTIFHWCKSLSSFISSLKVLRKISFRRLVIEFEEKINVRDLMGETERIENETTNIDMKIEFSYCTFRKKKHVALLVELLKKQFFGATDIVVRFHCCLISFPALHWVSSHVFSTNSIRLADKEQAEILERELTSVITTMHKKNLPKKEQVKKDRIKTCETGDGSFFDYCNLIEANQFPYRLLTPCFVGHPEFFYAKFRKSSIPQCCSRSCSRNVKLSQMLGITITGGNSKKKRRALFSTNCSRFSL